MLKKLILFCCLSLTVFILAPSQLLANQEMLSNVPINNMINNFNKMSANFQFQQPMTEQQAYLAFTWRQLLNDIMMLQYYTKNPSNQMSKEEILNQQQALIKKFFYNFRDFLNVLHQGTSNQNNRLFTQNQILNIQNNVENICAYSQKSYGTNPCRN